MKKVLILFLLLVMPFVSAKAVDITLGKYDSYMKDGINITLMNIDKDKTKFILCVNGEEHIFTEEGRSKEYFTIKVDDINKDEVDLSVDINCEDCICEGKCNNKRCFPNPKYEYKIKNESTKEFVEEEFGEEGIVGNYAWIIFIILFIAIIITAYYVIKRRV